MENLLLEAKDLVKEFPAGRRKKLHAVSGVSLRLYRGETLGLVGESGCGKSTLARLMVRLITPTSGQILMDGIDLTALSDKAYSPYRRRLQMVFQDPYASLDPRMTVRDLIAEPMETFRACPSGKETTRKVRALLEAVGLPQEALYRYPGQFSGGQRQRIGIARAISQDPDLIVCDEPVSALDISVQNQILNLLSDLKKARGMAYLFISHDLTVVRHLSDRVAVMFLGRICETGPTRQVFAAPMHPYTRLLLNAVPRPDPLLGREDLPLLTGEVPSAVDPPSGCRFRTRCPYAREKCAREVPSFAVRDGQEAACHFPLPAPS